MPISRRLIECLEPRRVFASDWQNAVLPLDVDASGLVVPLDALHIVNDINNNGVRQLPASKPVGFAGPHCDTNGDGVLSGLDVLMVVNAINQFPDAPSLTVKLSTASDRNGDQVVLVPEVMYQGTSAPGIQVKVERLEGEQSTVAAQTTASASGEFQVPLALQDAITHLRFTVSDPRGRSLATERIVRQGDAVSSWNAALLEIVRETTSPSSSVPGLLVKPPPPMVAKYLAMVHGAMFDAINAVQGHYDSYLLGGGAQSGASPVAAAAVAAWQVATSIYSGPEQLTVWDNTLVEIMALVPDGQAKTLGTQLGEQAAEAMLANRANDGSQTTQTYIPGTAAGQWRPTAPDFSPATLPQWPAVEPFVIEAGDRFRPTPAPALTSAEYAQAVDQVRRLGAKENSERTADQTLIAKFWADGGGTSTPPGHWNQIAVDVGLENDLSLLENARMMAMLNFAMADAGIAAWDAKYAYSLWRPIDAVRGADGDGNAATTADASWTPLLNTPSFPSYVSGHSAFSGAAAAVLSSLFGQNYSFTTRADRGSTGVWPPSDDVTQLQSRSFTSFEQAAQEAGLSRVYGGIHYSFDNTAGLAVGKSIGQAIVSGTLQPV